MFDRFNLWVGSLIARTQDLKNESGQTFVEYALVIAVISVGVLLAVLWTDLGTALKGAIDDIAAKLNPTP